MDWDNVRAFLAVARQGQFLAAAKTLKVNQATMARRVSALEESLQTTLFERSTTGAALTEAGRTLLTHAERMESAMIQAEADLARRDVHLSGPVRIGAPDGFTTYFLIPELKSFTERHPLIDVQIVPMPVAVSLARREVDIAVTLEEPEAGRVVARRLVDYRLGIYGAKTYLDAHGRPQTVEDLAAHRLIGYVESYAFSSALSYVKALFGGHHTRIECASAVGQLEAVRAGLGLGVLHHFIAEQVEGLEPVLTERQEARRYWLMMHEDTRALGRVRALVDHLVNAATLRKASFWGAF